MASVQLNGLTKHYGEIKAVDDLTLTVHDGEFVVLAGPSGCGKTTILRMIAGLEKPSQGQVVIGEQVVNDLAPQQRQVGMVFQGHAFYPHLTVQANMEFGFAGRKVSRAEVHAKVLETARLLQIEGLLERFPQELSGGERQRVALGKTLAADPQVWLLDEPFSHLDTNLRYTLRNELTRLRQQVGITTILVTPDLSEAMSLADRIAIVHHGQLLQCGTPAEIYDRPGSRLVAESWGLPPINLLNAHITQAASNSVDVAVDNSPLRVTVHGNLEALTEGQSVTLGIRPEDVYVTKAGGSSPQNGLPVTLVRVERTGADVLLHLQCGSLDLIARAASRSVAELSGDLRIEFDPQSIQLFDQDTGLRITQTATST